MKLKIIDAAIAALQSSLTVAEEAAKQAKNLATDEQSKAETQYDTVAIEAAFLAHGQSERVAQLKYQIAYWHDIQRKNIDSELITAGSAFALTCESGDSRHYLMSDDSGGDKLVVNGVNWYVVSRLSPIGKACWDKSLDDDVSFQGIDWWVSEIF